MHTNVRRLDLFGTAAARQATATSDYDFLVKFPTLWSGASAEAYFGMREGLEVLLGAPFDLLAIGNPYFREAVRASRRRVYGA